MSIAPRRPRGRPPAARPPDVVALAARQFRSAERVDLQAIADQLGLSRTTIYRWFGGRDALLGRVIAAEAEEVICRARRRVGGHGAGALLETFDAINRAFTASSALRAYVLAERQAALRLLTRSDGVVQPRSLAAIRAVIDAEVAAGAFRPPMDTDTLAYAIVRLAEAFLYNDAVADLRGEVGRLRIVEAALLGVPEAAATPWPAGVRAD